MLKNKSIIIILVLYSFIVSFFYNYFVLTNFDDFSIKLKNVKNEQFELPPGYTYLLKIWGLEPAKEINFNKNKVFPFYVRERGDLKEFYITIPSQIVQDGANELQIISSVTYSARIQNYIGKLEPAKVAILFKSSIFFKTNPLSTIRFILSVILVIFLLSAIFIFISFLTRKYFDVFSKKIYLSYFLSYIPFFLFFFIFYIFSKFTPYRIIVSPKFFIGLSIFLIAIVQFTIFFYVIFKQDKTQLSKIKSQIKLQRQIYLDSNPKKIIKFIQWLQNREFSDKCILIFIVLLIICTFLLILHLEFISEQSANMAYLALLIGTIIKFVKLVRAGEGE